MDVDRAIQIFLEHVEQLPQLPFITDSEMKTLYGEEVIEALEALARVNKEKQYCQNCQNRCCPAVKCELYAPQFDRCPIFELRPPICRLHYCHQFFDDGDITLKELSNVFFDGLVDADRRGYRKVRFFDCPPLKNCCPDFVEATKPWMEMVQEGKLAPETAMQLIRQEAEKYRTPTQST